MTAILSTTELRNMQEKDLQGEIMSQKALVAKLKMGIQLQKEKDSAKYQREKKTLARMETVLSEKNGSKNSAVSSDSPKSKGLRKKAKSSKLPAQS